MDALGFQDIRLRLTAAMTSIGMGFNGHASGLAGAGCRLDAFFFRKQDFSRLSGYLNDAGFNACILDPMLDLAYVNLSDLLHRLAIVRFMRKAKTGGGHDLHSRPARNFLTEANVARGVKSSEIDDGVNAGSFRLR